MARIAACGIVAAMQRLKRRQVAEGEIPSDLGCWVMAAIEPECAITLRWFSGAGYPWPAIFGAALVYLSPKAIGN